MSRTVAPTHPPLALLLSLVLAATATARAAEPTTAPASSPSPSAPSTMGSSPATPPAAKREEPPDRRPIIRLKVLNAFKPEDKIFPQVVEGRLISDLADMETFRTVASDKRGDYLLTATIRSVALNQYDTYKQSRDAESDGAPTTQNEMNVTMLLELSLENREGKEVYSGKLSSEAAREVDVSTEQTVNLATQELIDRAAQRLEKLLRKKLKKLEKS